MGEVESGQRAYDLKLDQLRTALSLQERRLTLLLEEARRRLPEPFDPVQLQTFAEELPHVADAGYLAFEDAFRGSREEVKQRVSIYVAKLRAAEAGTDKAPILDLGCGRGELLEVLEEQGLKASGVDSNTAAVDQCRELKLDVLLGDAFEELAKLPDGSLGGLTALHVVEHLPFPLVMKLLDETLRVLRPGGIVIFETPNPNNILVGATNFYLDPTHRNPVHPQTLRYLLEARGLTQVETMMLHPYPREMRIPEDTAVARTFNEYFYGPQDYAVLGRRP
jgi:O-antigen chain-terminating methyltransferase